MISIIFSLTSLIFVTRVTTINPSDDDTHGDSTPLLFLPNFDSNQCILDNQSTNQTEYEMLCQMFERCKSNATHQNSMLLNSCKSIFSASTLGFVSESSMSSKDDHHELRDRVKPPIHLVWILGFVTVTVINLIALIGACFMPIMSSWIYEYVMALMIGLAVGSLCGSSLIHLIPGALALQDKRYLNVALSIFGGIYVFMVVERLLKITIIFKERKDEKKKQFFQDLSAVSPSNLASPFSLARKEIVCDGGDEDGGAVKFNGGGCELSSCPVNNGKQGKEHVDIKFTDSLVDNEVRLAVRSNKSFPSTPSDDESGGSAGGGPFYNKSGKKVASLECIGNPACGAEPPKIETVAWMIVFGDAVHNFTDGLAIGAAFESSIVVGFSVCLAVFGEELPHELGDFAALLHGGMSVKKAMFYNFVSACSSYIGLILGIVISTELASADLVIFGAAGGLFLYISLVDMTPILTDTIDDLLKTSKFGKAAIVFTIQSVGMFCGIGSLYMLAKYDYVFEHFIDTLWPQ